MLQALFLLTFFFYGPVSLLFFAAVAVTALDLLEEILMVLILDHYRTYVRGLYQAFELKRSPVNLPPD